MAGCQVVARKLFKGEELPFHHGLEPLELDPEWGWVAEAGGVVVGVLLLAPVHGSVMLVRLVGAENAPRIWFKKVLTLASKDVLARGYKVAFCHFNLEQPQEARLAKIIMGHGKSGRRAVSIAQHALCVSSIEDWQ